MHAINTHNLRNTSQYLCNHQPQPADIKAHETTTIIAMARNLSMAVLAEGVGNAAQLTFLQARGCDLYQGDNYCKALPADAFAARFLTAPHA